MFNDLSSPLSLLTTRRSGKPRDMIAPGPDEAQLQQILSIATRTPDHGKLFPWRLVAIGADQRNAFAALLREALRAERPGASEREIDTVVNDFAYQAPTLVVVISAPRQDAKIPKWEQELSAGAVCMNLLHAVHAMGFVGGWLTGWAAYSDKVRNAFGTAPEQIAGFIFIGSPSRPLEERPRPEPEQVIGQWEPPPA